MLNLNALSVIFIIAISASSVLAQVNTGTETGRGRQTKCGTTLSGNVIDLGPDGMHVLPIRDTEIELEFFSKADIFNDTNHDADVRQLVQVHIAETDPFHVGVYTKGPQIDSEREDRTVDHCTNELGWKVSKDRDFSTGHYYVVGTIAVVLDEDTFAFLDSKEQVFSVREAGVDP